MAKSGTLSALSGASPEVVGGYGAAVGGVAGQATADWLAELARREPRTDTSQGDFIEGLARTNPEALGPYAAQLQRASAEGNLALAHWHLQQTDPQYRATIEALRKEQSQ
jgi:hypothetical protein